MFFGGNNTSYYGRISPTSPTKSPVWGNVCSPFRNTQMPLQEITMNQTCLVNGTSLKSPGKVPPAGARTMKDYEDHLEALKSENFQLKLRVFFLEERMGIIGAGAADEDPIRKNIELKVEVENLKKEIVEKQELLSQAAKAFELHEEQKEVTRRNQIQYEQSLENERQRIVELENEMEEYKEKFTNSSIYYQEAFGISPEIALENKEKLNQMEELVGSLEAQVHQLTSSLQEERTWGQEIETERDALKTRLEEETRAREKLAVDKDLDIETLREKVKELEEEAFRRESVAQQYKTELAEKDRIIKEKILLLDEKCRACEELNATVEKRKKQIDQLRVSVKSRDEALGDSNNKYRTLLNQFETNRRFSPPSSPSSFDETLRPHSVRSSLRSAQIMSPTRAVMGPFDWDSRREKVCATAQTQSSIIDNSKELQDLLKQLENKDRELKQQDEEKKQLILKLCNIQQSADLTEKELKKLKPQHEQALKMIQKFCLQQSRLEERHIRKEQNNTDQYGLKKSAEPLKLKKNELMSSRKHLEYEISDGSDDRVTQQRFEEMETKINDLRDEITSIKAEKCKLERQIHDESEELRHQLSIKQKEIEDLVRERDQIDRDLHEKEMKIKQLEENHLSLEEFEELRVQNLEEIEKLKTELSAKRTEVNEQNRKIEQLSKDLQIKTQNLQKLVNTELWSKNKEIAKLHNHMTANRSYDKSSNKSEAHECISQLDILVKELIQVGVQVKFNEDAVQLNYLKDGKYGDIKTMAVFIQKLTEEKTRLQNEIDSLTWFKLMSKSDAKIGEEIESGNPKAYCELLRTHLKGLVKFMKEILKSSNYTEDNEQKKIIIDFLASTKILSEDLAQVLEDVPLTINDLCICEEGQELIKSQTKLVADEIQRQGIKETGQSDSETFSEPDRSVSLARIGLRDVHFRSQGHVRFSKLDNTFSDSEDSLDYVPCHKTYQPDLSDVVILPKSVEYLKETCKCLCSDFNSLRNDLIKKSMLDSVIESKLLPIMNKLEKSQEYCDKVKTQFEKKIQEYNTLKKDKQNVARKLELDKKIIEAENRAVEMAIQFKEDNARITNGMMMRTVLDNEAMKMRIEKLEEENDLAHDNVAALTKDLDRLTLSHSQVLVENTKLTNEKLKLEQEMRKAESRYENSVRSINDKFTKEVNELNHMNEAHRSRMQDLEATNKELRRRVVCETSDSAPSSSGVSSVPTDTNLNKPCDDILQEFHSYSSSQYWLPISYPSSSGRSKSSCSPDLGIESDAAVSTRPLKDTLKITESMTNLLSDEENCNNNNNALRDLDRESPLHIEGLDEVEALKQENEALKKRLMKTRRALEDTFEHLSASNRNKKNVEKAITKQLMITKSILKKTRTYEEPFEN